ncbi:MAG: lysophospholipid acyltransferase family protein [Capnocytophaga sp.]|nr:lysophospholipid acyltransferase family protein [Capnocytophaga sp.]
MQLIIFILAYPFLWLISLLPNRIFYALSDVACFLIYNILGYRKKVVRENLTLAFPDKSLTEIKEIERNFYHHFCDIFLEMLKTINFSKKEMQERMTYTNKEVLKIFEERQQSFIIMCGHYNSYEWLLSLAAQIPHKSYALYTPISNKYFNNFIQKIRQKFNSFLISRYKATEIIRKQQKNKELCAYGLASDQSPSSSPKHYWRTFMGVYVPVFTGAERLAKQFNIPVVFCDIQKKKRGYYETTFIILSENPTEVPDFQITDAFTNLLEKQIKTKPEFYLWSHNRFKHQKPKPIDNQ